jgi:cbb3-type cytochrome oxidase cytochrome c subunit
MKIIAALPLILILGACQVSKDDANDTVSVTYNSDVAENAAADVANTAENIAGDISNDVSRTADKVQNTDIDVNVNSDVQTNNQ